MDIREITAADTRPIRQSVLRPTQAAEALVYPGDDAPESLHVGAFVDGALVGIASVYLQSRDDEAGAWRLRGMAVVPEFAGRGYGRALFDATVAHAREHGGRSYWCNARTSARGFYLGRGMRQIGDEFELPAIGPHVVMEMVLDRA